MNIINNIRMYISIFNLIIKSFYNYNYILYPIVFYINFIKTNIYTKCLIYLYILCELYYNKIYILDYIIGIKIYLQKLYIKYFINNNFILCKVLLYTDLDTNINVTKTFKKIINSSINSSISSKIFTRLYRIYNLRFIYNSNIRLKIFFKFYNRDYIIYYQYSRINKEIPYPIYTDDIMTEYKKDIIKPYYNIYGKKSIIYSLFNMDCKDISNVSINNNENLRLLKYIKMIQTPFNDFGILYKLPVKLIWVLKENYINIKTFKNINISFSNMYFDEDNFELKNDFINLSNKDINNIIISKRIENILNIYNKKYISNN